MPNLDELTAGQARQEATQPEPEWDDRLDSARDGISNAMNIVLSSSRTVVNGKLKSMAPHRELALDLLRSAVENLQKAMGEI